MKNRKKFAVLISGYGRGAIEIIHQVENGVIHPTLSLIISSVSNSHCIRVAQEKGIPTLVVERAKFTKKADFENAVLQELHRGEIDYLFLSGWNLIVGETLLAEFRRKIVNIHPSLLPSFKGLNAIDQALLYGVKITGITTHFVDSSLDGGEIILQRAVEINEGDNFESLDTKIFNVGIELIVQTINEYFI